MNEINRNKDYLVTQRGRPVGDDLMNSSTDSQPIFAETLISRSNCLNSTVKPIVPQMNQETSLTCANPTQGPNSSSVHQSTTIDHGTRRKHTDQIQRAHAQRESRYPKENISSFHAAVEAVEIANTELYAFCTNCSICLIGFELKVKLCIPCGPLTYYGSASLPNRMRCLLI